MKYLLYIVISSFLLTGCDHGVEWSEGDYEVHWIDTSNNRTLARIINENASIGRVDPEVIAVGSNSEYVVAKQRDPDNGEISYFIVEKAKDEKYLNMSEVTEGPFSEAMFMKMRKVKNLPDFTAVFGSG